MRIPVDDLKIGLKVVLIALALLLFVSLPALAVSETPAQFFSIMF